MHKKWDTNVAILSGDGMIAYAYHSLLQTKTSRIRDLMNIFTKAFVEVCEGQGFDKEFESRAEVSLGEYMHMIKKKTARVISAAVEMGAIIGGATRREQIAVRTYGEHLGIAFQIQDDLLDIVGSENEFGKAIGGDVIERKKTYLFLTALDRGSRNDRALLRSSIPKNVRRHEHINRVKALYEDLGVIDTAKKEIARHTLRAQRALVPLASSVAKDILLYLSDQLKVRTN